MTQCVVKYRYSSFMKEYTVERIDGTDVIDEYF